MVAFPPAIALTLTYEGEKPEIERVVAELFDVDHAFELAGIPEPDKVILPFSQTEEEPSPCIEIEGKVYNIELPVDMVLVVAPEETKVKLPDVPEAVPVFNRR
jgi:hypothetical protein